VSQTLPKIKLNQNKNVAEQKVPKRVTFVQMSESDEENSKVEVKLKVTDLIEESKQPSYLQPRASLDNEVAQASRVALRMKAINRAVKSPYEAEQNQKALWTTP